MEKHGNNLDIQPGLFVSQDAEGQVTINFIVPKLTGFLELSAKDARSMLMETLAGKMWRNAADTCEIAVSTDCQTLLVARGGGTLFYKVGAVAQALYTAEFVEKAIAAALAAAKK